MSTKTETERSTIWLAQLQSSGYRITPSRKAVVEILAESDRALNPSQIFIMAQARCKSLGLVSVYRTLEKLEELGLACRVHQETGCHAYVPAPSGHEHLLICIRCNRAEYFTGDNLSEWFTQIGDERGYHIVDHWLQLFGLCSECKNSQ